MLNRISRTRLVGFWFATIALVIAWVAGTGVNVSTSTAALLLTMCLVPPAILLFLWRGTAPSTIGELLYSVNKKEDRS